MNHVQPSTLPDRQDDIHCTRHHQDDLRQSDLDNERGGDDQEDPGELQPQTTVLGTEALQPQGHVAGMTQSSANEDVQRNHYDDWNDGDETAIDRVHNEVRKIVLLAAATDLQTSRRHAHFTISVARSSADHVHCESK